jgi:hypothetical protein
MSIEDDARRICGCLRGLILSGDDRPRVTYGQVEHETRVPFGPFGEYMGKVLGLISWGCATAPTANLDRSRRARFASDFSMGKLHRDASP